MLLTQVHSADAHDRLGAGVQITRAAPSNLPRMELVWAASPHLASGACLGRPTALQVMSGGLSLQGGAGPWSRARQVNYASVTTFLSPFG